MKISGHPVWQVGFRSFFILTALAGIILPILWAFIFSGTLGPLNHSISPIQWHAHEMFFGFGFAVLGGFLLTATKNWVNIRGFHGSSLIFLTAVWIIERITIAFGENLTPVLFFLFHNLFLSLLTLMVLWTLIWHQTSESSKDNFYFVLMLPLFLVSKNLILSSQYFALGSSMSLGLFRLAALLMLERTLTQFMKNACQVNILRNVILDAAIKLLSFILIFETLIPAIISTWIIFGLVILLVYRFIFWKPQVALKRLDIGIMYLGYIALVLQLSLLFINYFIEFNWIGAVSVHIFTFGVMGIIIPPMMMRISKGHTGRSVVFDKLDKLTLWIMILAFFIRIVLTQLYPERYLLWISLAALCWLGSFSILFIRLTPMLLKPRVDGKEH